MHIKNLVLIFIFTLLLNTSAFAATEKPNKPGPERQPTVVLETNSSIADSDYQIVQLYGTRTNQSDVLLYTVTNAIDGRGYDEYGNALPENGQSGNITDIKIVGKYYNTTNKKWVDLPKRTKSGTKIIPGWLHTIKATSKLHNESPENLDTQLQLRFEITPQKNRWYYQDVGSSIKKNVYDGYYIVQRDEIHDKRNTTTKSNVSESKLMLNLSDPNGSAGKFNDQYIDKHIKRSQPVRLLPNFYPATTSLSEFDQVYWYGMTENSVSQNQLLSVLNSDKCLNLPNDGANGPIMTFMKNEGRMWSEISNAAQLNFNITEKMVDSVYVYCMAHHTDTDKWLVSNIEKVYFDTEGLLYTATMHEGDSLALEALKANHGKEKFIDTESGTYTTEINNITELKLTSYDSGGSLPTWYVLPGNHTYYGTVKAPNLPAGGMRCALQIFGNASSFDAVQLQRPNLGESWGTTSGENLLHTSNQYFTYKYGSMNLTYPDNGANPNVKITSIIPQTGDYIREPETLMKVTLEAFGVTKQATFIAKARFSGADTTDTSTTILSIALTKTGDISVTNQEILDNDVSKIRDKLSVVATRFDGKKMNVTEDALFNIRKSGNYAIIIATYAQCSSSISIRISS